MSDLQALVDLVLDEAKRQNELQKRVNETTIGEKYPFTEKDHIGVIHQAFALRVLHTYIRKQKKVAA